MGYCAYLAFTKPCTRFGVFESSNVFKAEDKEMIAVFILDVLAAVMFVSAGANVARRAM